MHLRNAPWKDGRLGHRSHDHHPLWQRVTPHDVNCPSSFIMILPFIKKKKKELPTCAKTVGKSFPLSGIAFFSDKKGKDGWDG